MSLAPVAQALLDYWFAGTPEECKARWWQKNEAVDQEIRAQFGDHVDEAVAGTYDGWQTTARGTLALILLLDQVTRTIARGSARSFIGDAKAREVLRDALDRGADKDLSEGAERSFLYMPLMHSERLADHDLSLTIFAALGESHPEFAGFSGYAKSHRDIVEQWGRYPHRNEALGRVSTPQELVFLEGPNSGF
ncbi:MAG: DUF924 domain-containing protein [Deltaproteobacteria bacterium]|nr:DUF924 domain-containing protein [Deltaproteobacteria bacterium]